MFCDWTVWRLPAPLTSEVCQEYHECGHCQNRLPNILLHDRMSLSEPYILGGVCLLPVVRSGSYFACLV